jgi:hypothetical protein
MLGPTWYSGDTDAPAGGVYHYTSRNALTRILQEGVLRPHKAMPTDRTALLWFSSNGIWEPASGRGLPWDPSMPMSFDALAQANGGLARLLVDAEAAPLSWPHLQRMCSPQWLALLQGEAGAWVRANCHRWRGTTKPVSREHWLAVEVWKAPRWVEMAYSWEREV